MRATASMRAAALAFLLLTLPCAECFCSSRYAQLIGDASVAKPRLQLRMALSQHWQKQRSAFRSAFIEKSEMFNRDRSMMLKFFYDPLYDRERVVNLLTSETELPKDYVASVFDKAMQLGSMELCYQTADDALRTMLKMRDQNPPIYLTMKEYVPTLVPEREPYPE